MTASVLLQGPVSIFLLTQPQYFLLIPSINISSLPSINISSSPSPNISSLPSLNISSLPSVNISFTQRQPVTANSARPGFSGCVSSLAFFSWSVLRFSTYRSFLTYLLMIISKKAFHKGRETPPVLHITINIITSGDALCQCFPLLCHDLLFLTL